MRVYLLVFNGGLMPRQTVLDYLDTRREVLNWYAFLSTGVFIVSRSTPHELSMLLHQRFASAFFVLAEIEATKANGFLPKPAWDFINNPRSSGRWE